MERELGGKAAASLHRQALGIASDQEVPGSARKSISKETTFATDVHDHATLREALRRLAADVAARARRERLSGSVVTLKIRFEGFETRTRQHTGSAPTHDEREIFRTAWRLFLDGQLPKKPVRLIGVGISGWEKSAPAQADLFDEPGRSEGNERLLNAIDAVAEKFGKGMLQVGVSRNNGK